jgi:hypothetical protein
MSMAISSVPDKLSVMTYLFQIKTHFTKPMPQAVPHRKHKPFSLFKKNSSSSNSKNEKQEDESFRLKLEAKYRLSQNIEDFHYQDFQTESKTDKFAEPKESVNELKTIEVPSDKESHVGLDDVIADLTEHASDEITRQKDSESPVKRRVRTKIDIDDVKRKSGFNPFEDEDIVESPTEKLPSVTENTTISDSSLKSDNSTLSEKPAEKESDRSSIPPKDYNPFDEDEPESPSPETNRLAQILTENKSTTGYNPFDVDSDEGLASPTDKPTQTKAETTHNAKTSQERFGFNPFEDDEDVKSTSNKIVSSTSNKDKDSSYGYNPFEDDDDEEEAENEQSKKGVTQVPTKSAPFQRTRITASGRRIKLPAPKPRGVPYRPKQEKATVVSITTRYVSLYIQYMY